VFQCLHSITTAACALIISKIKIFHGLRAFRDIDAAMKHLNLAHVCILVLELAIFFPISPNEHFLTINVKNIVVELLFCLEQTKTNGPFSFYLC
jgi:hypothetical protein